MTPEHYYELKTDSQKLCACGCGKPIERTAANSKYRFTCKKDIEREQARRYAREKREAGVSKQAATV